MILLLLVLENIFMIRRIVCTYLKSMNFFTFILFLVNLLFFSGFS